MEKKEYRGHVLAVPYPAQGHINPLLQFCKRLASKGFKATLAISTFIANSNGFADAPATVHLETISDGFDDGGFAQAESIAAYLSAFEAAGSKSLAHLVRKLADSDHPINCIVYDSFMPWALDVAKQQGTLAATFFTQAVAVGCIYYRVNRGLLRLPIPSPPVEIPGLPPLEIGDMPGYFARPAEYPAYFAMVLEQYYNVDKADFVLVNSFYELEAKAVDSMQNLLPMLTIGPTIPSQYLDNRVDGDKTYGLSLLDPGAAATSWLATKPPGSVVYISFGSMASLPDLQTQELAWGLMASNSYFLWVTRSSEPESELPRDFVERTRDTGLFVNWCRQLEVLANEAVGCFVSHCGWNSILEALSLGVRVVAMPLWTDQTTNAKLVEDAWGVGVRVKANDEGLMGRDEIEACISRVMVGEEGRKMKANAKRWSDLAKKAVSEGGSSDKNIDEFVSKFASS
ncbi:hypothetical protein Nepgr_020113 [Nepenthes gracilis]|uniref:Glycosyltransferase n=1 Tax=Nepenthes gracilis TaxID=150966 RepID=A0AAD3SXD7_NEPGR|nr:hypothetical protein Nepgr_020113 [Nepenthes gracilis]